MCLHGRHRGRHQGSEGRWDAMRALSFRPFCPCDSRRVSLWYLSAGCRYTTRHPQWRKRRLAQLLGTRYQHVQALGNRNYKNGGPIELADYEAGKQAIAEILATGQSVILMCACKDVATCHRRTAAEQLAADLGVPITHLVPPK